MRLTGGVHGQQDAGDALSRRFRGDLPGLGQLLFVDLPAFQQQLFDRPPRRSMRRLPERSSSGNASSNFSGWVRTARVERSEVLVCAGTYGTTSSSFPQLQFKPINVLANDHGVQSDLLNHKSSATSPSW